jgi:hypothetical protein
MRRKEGTEDDAERIRRVFTSCSSLIESDFRRVQVYGSELTLSSSPSSRLFSLVFALLLSSSV